MKRADPKLPRLPQVEIRLSESGDNRVPTLIQVGKVGSFKKDPVTGRPFKITTEMLHEMVRNFDERVRGIDIAVDYFHDNDKIAAGWFRKLEVRENGTQLWAEVVWTPKAVKHLSDKELRYLSPEYHPAYEDPETGKKYGCVLMGAGLTNRPFLKHMTPAVELSESEEEEMKTIAELEAQIAKLSETNKTLEAKVVTLSEETGEDSKSKLKAKIEAMEKELTESKKKLAEMEDEKKLSEKKGRFDKMLSEGKAVEAQRDAFMKDDLAKFAELQGTPNLKAAGHAGAGGTGASSSEDADAQIEALAEKKLSEKQAKNYREAVSMVLKEKPELAKARTA